MEKRDRPVKITPAMIEAAWQTMPSPYDRDERGQGSYKEDAQRYF